MKTIYVIKAHKENDKSVNAMSKDNTVYIPATHLCALSDLRAKGFTIEGIVKAEMTRKMSSDNRWTSSAFSANLLYRNWYNNGTKIEVDENDMEKAV